MIVKLLLDIWLKLNLKWIIIVLLWNIIYNVTKNTHNLTEKLYLFNNKNRRHWQFITYLNMFLNLIHFYVLSKTIPICCCCTIYMYILNDCMIHVIQLPYNHDHNHTNKRMSSIIGQVISYIHTSQIIHLINLCSFCVLSKIISKVIITYSGPSWVW